MTTIITDTRYGPVETNITDLADKPLRALAGTGHPEAIREFWRRKLGTPRWASRLNSRLEGGR